MRATALSVAIALPLLMASPAEARTQTVAAFPNFFGFQSQAARPHAIKRTRHYRGHSRRGHRHVRIARARHGNVAVRGGDPRPGAWCAWYVRQQKGISVAYGNLAHGLMRWGRPSGPEVGAIAIWRRRHAGIIVGSCPGGVLVRSGNTWGRNVSGGVGTGCYALSTFRGFRA